MSIPQWISAVFATLLAVGTDGRRGADLDLGHSRRFSPMESMRPERVDEIVTTRRPGPAAR